MKIEKGCNPNCSESIMRFETTKLTAEQEEKLFETLNSYVEQYGYETSVYRNNVFGIKCITVDGDASYNSSDEIRKSVSRLSFINKVKIESEEK
jgi:hypothetical protein